MKNLFLGLLSALLVLTGATAASAAKPAKKGKAATEVKKTCGGCDSTTVKHPDWLKNAVIYEVNLRQGIPGRNLKGLQAQLGRLKDLGADVLWLMPMHPISQVNRKGTLGSYYAVADYLKINPEFGSIDDLKAVVKEAHNKGMKVILDEVCNHTGCDNVWVKKHPDFYAKNDKGEKYGPFDWTDTYQLDYSNPKLRKAMKEALIYWVKEADIDGYRCDVAGMVPTDFWVEVRPELDKIKPVFMLAEASKADLTRNAFDADYNWPMKDVFNAIAATQGANTYAVEKRQALPYRNALSIDTLLKKQHCEYPKGAFNMNMITNHDLNSWEGTEFDRLGPATGAFAVLSYTLPGLPMLYSGQEVGFNHPFEFFELDSVQPNYKANGFTTFYEVLNALRHKNQALWTDANMAPMTRYATANPDVYVFTRERNGQKVLVVANLSGKVTRVEFTDKTPDPKGMVNIFNATEEALPEILQPWEYRVLSTPLK